ncbi:MAG TPA: SEC-C domain-containing protein [Clostridiaceae bacterium]|nr:SEC-C domain-containing protein [Clostridiaceae bacterium]
MVLFEEWKKLTESESTNKNYQEFWTEYFEKEKATYEYILANHNEVISGKLSEIASKFNMNPVTMTGFLDGINSSLVESINLEELAEDTELKLEIDFEKLYYNMLAAKADWLYNLPQWDNVLDEKRRTEIKKEYNKSRIAVSNKVGRNEPCPCGSGKKYKKCCGK